MCRSTMALPLAGVKLRSGFPSAPMPLARDRLDQIAHHDDPQPVPFHVEHAARPVEHAHVAGHAHVNQCIDATLLAKVEQFAAVVAVGDEIRVGDL